MNRNRNRYGGSGMSTAGRIFAGLALAGIGMILLGMMFPAAAVACCPCLTTLLCCGLGAAGGAAAAASAANGGSHYYSSSSNNNGSNNNYSGFGKNNDYSSYGNSNNNGNSNGWNSDAPYSEMFGLGNNSFGGSNKNRAFEEQVRQAKEAVESHSRRTNSTTNIQSQTQPHSGQYISSFVESGVTHKVTMYLIFTPSPHHHPPGCYTISGQGNDIDGTTVVEEGLLTPDGMAWWRERTLTGDVGLLLLSRGKFAFSGRSDDEGGSSSSSFQGTWLASSGVGGTYLSFTAAAAAAAATASGSTTQQERQHHHPAATAPPLVVTPVEVTGVPIISNNGGQHQSPYMPPVVIGQPIS